MARGNPGKIVQFTNSDGKPQKGIMRYSDQHFKFKAAKKAFLRLIDDDFRILKDEKGSDRVKLVSIERLTLLGHID